MIHDLIELIHAPFRAAAFPLAVVLRRHQSEHYLRAEKLVAVWMFLLCAAVASPFIDQDHSVAEQFATLGALYAVFAVALLLNLRDTRRQARAGHGSAWVGWGVPRWGIPDGGFTQGVVLPFAVFLASGIVLWGGYVAAALVAASAAGQLVECVFAQDWEPHVFSLAPWGRGLSELEPAPERKMASGPEQGQGASAPAPEPEPEPAPKPDRRGGLLTVEQITAARRKA